MDYDFVKLSDVPVAEDGATHVLGTKDGQVVRVPASGLGAVALDLEIAGASAGPTSVLDASPRDANFLAGATLKLPGRLIQPMIAARSWPRSYTPR